MRVVCRADQELRIHEHVRSPEYVILRYWVHVVDDDPSQDIIALDTEVASVVSHDKLITQLLPFGRSIEHLIEVPIVAERVLSDATVIQLEISESLLEGLELHKLRVGPDLLARHRRYHLPLSSFAWP